MAKISRSYRLDESVIEKIDLILPHVQARYDYVSETVKTPSKKAVATDVIEFVINYTYEKLKEDGDI